MTAVAKYASNGTAPGRRVSFWCPGCDCVHQVIIDAPDAAWTFNGDLERPTFAPSVLTRWFGYPRGIEVAPGEVQAVGEQVCHCFVTDGRIQFLGDSTHHLAGQTVDLSPWPYGDEESS